MYIPSSMASSPGLPSGETRASSPATSCGIATHAQTGGETPVHAQREDAPVSAGKLERECQYNIRHGEEWRPDKGCYCTSDIGAVACFLLYINCLGGVVPLSLTGSIESGSELAFYGRGFLLSTELYRTVQS